MNKKHIAISLCILLSLPIQATPNPYANNYGPAETKEEFIQLLKNDWESARKRAAAGDPDAYRYVAKRLEAGYKHSWLMKNPGTAVLYILGGTVAFAGLIILLAGR